MSGLMEILEQLNSSPVEAHFAIIPTVLLPLAFLSTGITIAATFVAGFFGIKLKAEGPKKLLEVLLKPKVLISALIFNAFIYGGMELYDYLKNGPVPFVIQNFKNKNIELNQKANVSDLKLHWKQSVGEGIFTEGVISGGEIFVGSKEGNMFVLDLKTGELKDKLYFGKFLSPRPISYKNHLYFGEGLHKSHHMRVYKLEPISRKLIAHFETKGHTEMMAVTAQLDGEEYLFSSAGGDGLHAIDPVTMKSRWNFNQGHMDSYPTVFGKFLYIATGVPHEDIGIKRAHAYKIDIKTGKEVWKKELPLSSWFSPVVMKDQVCFTMGELHVKSNLGGIQCFDHDGNRGKHVLIERPIIGKHLAHKDNIVFNDFKGTLYSWNFTTGKINWKIDNSTEKYGFSASRKLTETDYLYFNRDGVGLVYNIDTGEVLKKFIFNDKETTFADPIVHSQGVLVFGLNGTIKNYKFPL